MTREASELVVSAYFDSTKLDGYTIAGRSGVTAKVDIDDMTHFVREIWSTVSDYLRHSKDSDLYDQGYKAEAAQDMNKLFTVYSLFKQGKIARL
jgi:hypothetical protein